MIPLIEKSSARLFSRELSWLSFNERVLDEAADPSTPLLERLKFLVIVSTNLEEFFMVRMPALSDMRKRERIRDEIPIARLIERIREITYNQKQRQARVFDELCKELAAAGLFIEQDASALAEEVFEDLVLPQILPIRIPDGDNLPPIKGGQLYLFAKHPNSASLIEIPSTLPRYLIVKSKHVFLVDRLIMLYKDRLFQKLEVTEIFSFKASRNAEISLDEESEDLLQDLEAQIKSRDLNAIVRLEVDSKTLSDSVRWLQKQLRIEDNLLYQLTLPLDLKSLSKLYSMKGFKKHKYHFPEPKRPAPLAPTLSRQKFFKAFEKHDVLLHHPYVSFDPVVDLVRHAAQDSRVTRICQTLYRTSGNSPLVEALVQAAQAKKQVTALVEIKARFDEANNIRWARALEKAGVRVVFGTPEIKIHAKLTYIERKATAAAARGFVHISTGNYHPNTARIYTDLGLLTSHPAYCQDARHLFNSLERMDENDDFTALTEAEAFSNGFKCWSVAPDNLHDRTIEWIDNETRNALQGRSSGIRAKMNGLVEASVIEALYRASSAGVKVDLMVRGMCCLRPGVPGLSDNIRVRSLVDKYLEHSRLFIFENAGNRQVWISSADWMPRNFFRRIEIAVPILNPQIITHINDVIWETYNLDNVKMRESDAQGIYRHVPVAEGAEKKRAQLIFEGLNPPDFPAEWLGDSSPISSPASPLKK